MKISHNKRLSSYRRRAWINKRVSSLRSLDAGDSKEAKKEECVHACGRKKEGGGHARDGCNNALNEPRPGLLPAPYPVPLPSFDPHCSIHWIEVSLRHESAGNNRANERLSRIRRRISDLSPATSAVAPSFRSADDSARFLTTRRHAS